ncbi:MAG: glycosyltransferase family 39 protein [Anaerolineae bacterium]
MFGLISRDVHPPLYYVIAKLSSSILPVSEWGLRVLPAFCSYLALVLIVGQVRRHVGTYASALAGWLLSWSSLHLYYAQDARMYALLDLCWVIAPWCLYQAIAAERTWAWLGWVIAGCAAFYTQFYGLLLWTSGLLWILAFWKQLSPRNRWLWVSSQGGMLISALPLISLILSTVARGTGGTWIPTLSDALRLWCLALLGFTPERSRFLYGDQLSLAPWNCLPYYHSYVLNFYRPPGAESVYGIVPGGGDGCELRRISYDGTLRGQLECVGCGALPRTHLSVYDPAGRRYVEGASWPPCLRDSDIWVFDAETQSWSRYATLVP